MLEIWVRSLGWEDPLKKEMATHSSSCLGNPKSLLGYSPWACKRVKHDLVTKHNNNMLIKDMLVVYLLNEKKNHS